MIRRKKKKKLRFKFKKFTVFVLFLDIACISLLVLIHNDKFMNFFITTAMTTKSHSYLARTLYDDKNISQTLTVKIRVSTLLLIRLYLYFANVQLFCIYFGTT